jgi:hypothetical protein
MVERREPFNPIKYEKWKAWNFTSMLPVGFRDVIISSYIFPLQMCVLENALLTLFFTWTMRLQALRPLLAYCASLG